MFEFDQYLGFLAFLSILTLGFWLMIFLLTFVIPIGFWSLMQYLKDRREKNKSWFFKNQTTFIITTDCRMIFASVGLLFG